MDITKPSTLETIVQNGDGDFDMQFFKAIDELRTDNDISTLVKFHGTIEVLWEVDGEDCWLDARVVGKNGKTQELEDEETGETIVVPVFSVVFDEDDFTSEVYLMGANELYNFNLGDAFFWRYKGSTFCPDEYDESMYDDLETKLHDKIHSDNCHGHRCIFFVPAMLQGKDLRQYIEDEVVRGIVEELKPHKEMFDSLHVNIQNSIGQSALQIKSILVQEFQKAFEKKWEQGDFKCLPDYDIQTITQKALDQIR